MVLNSSGKVNPVTDGISWPHHHSGWLTAISCLTMIFSIAIAGVYFSHIRNWGYAMPGTYASFFGLIAGPIGICAANSKRLSMIKCNWISHIVLCCLTMVGSVLGFSFGVLGTWRLGDDIRYQNSRCRDYDYTWDTYRIDQKCIRMFSLMSIETFLCFVVFCIGLNCTWSFGCVCGGCKGCCFPKPCLFFRENW